MQPSFTELASSLGRLSHLSVEGYYNPYKLFDWPEHLPEDQWWMSEQLLSVHGTRFMSELSDQQLKALSRWEGINFYSLNIHGIRELIIEVTRRIHASGYESLSGFLHHFLGEENEHMWFFAEFCKRYGGKIYADKRLKLDVGGAEDPEVEDFYVFSRILIFEDLVDYYNTTMSKDEVLPPIVRKINAIHHQDESRHIAFGRQIVENLHGRLRARYGPERLAELEAYLKNYIKMCIATLYNPSVYKDAGIADPYNFRTEVMQEPARQAQHERIMARTINFFVKSGIFASEQVFP